MMNAPETIVQNTVQTAFKRTHFERRLNGTLNAFKRRSNAVHRERSPRNHIENTRKNRERRLNGKISRTSPVHSPRFFRNGGEE